MTSLNYIIERIEKKKADYQHYNFSQRENTAIKTFFDLAQEFDSLDDLYMLSVAVPKSYYDLDARLYVVSSRTNQLSLAASTLQSDKPGKPAPAYLQPRDHPYITGDHVLILTLRGKRSHIDQLPFKTTSNVIGVLEVLKFDGSNVSEQVFFEKYANRIGYNIHNRFIAQKNVEHLKFIKSLVADIEHNIIVPNIIYKLYLRNLKSSIDKTSLIERQLSDCLDSGNCGTASLQAILTDLTETKRGLLGEYNNLEKHYKNMSLFLEALLRRSHFDQGRLTLRTTRCNINKEIVKPQLERFIERMHDAGIITDENLSGIPDEDIISVVDIGLMSQVYANLFSNALK